MTDPTSLQATAEALIDHHREELAARDREIAALKAERDRLIDELDSFRRPPAIPVRTMTLAALHGL